MKGEEQKVGTEDGKEQWWGGKGKEEDRKEKGKRREEGRERMDKVLEEGEGRRME